MQSRCRHTRINGARCTMPALNGRELCYEHEERKRLASLQRKVLPEPNSAPLVSFCYPEDRSSILANLHAIAEAFANHQIDYRQAGMFNRLMQTCLKTLWQMSQFEIDVSAEEIVREVTYDEAGDPMAADPAPRSRTIRTLTACAEAEPNHPISKHLHQFRPQPSSFQSHNTRAQTRPILFKHLQASMRGTSKLHPAPTLQAASATKPADLRTREAAQRR